jgi:hypothetical protein
MSSLTHFPSDVNVSSIEFGPVKMLDNGGKSVNLRYEGKNLMLETPSLSVPYGVSVFDKNGPPKFSVDLSLRGADEDAKVKALQDFLEAFDEYMIDAGVENAGKWLKMANPSRDVIKAFYTPVVKISRDQSGNPKPYPPTFKLALRKKKDGAFETDFYDGTQKPLAAFAKDTPIDQILPKRTQVTSIIQCTGLWFAGGKYGTTWKAVQLRVDSQPDQIRGPAFKTDAADVRAFVARNTVAAASAAASAAAGYGDEGEDEEDGADSGVLDAVMPQIPAAAPVAAKKVVAAATAPAAVAAAFEDETVVEAVPVPKKTVKKVVPAAKKA